MSETWKSVRGYGDGVAECYEVSDLGRVRRSMSAPERRNAYRGRVLKLAPNNAGYLVVGLCDGSGNTQVRYVHRVVMKAFDGGATVVRCEVNHLSGEKSDNRLVNLEWCSSSENAQHKVDTGLVEILRGEEIGNSKLDDGTVMAIRSLSKSGLTQQVIADRYGISQSSVSRVANGSGWAHVGWA